MKGAAMRLIWKGDGRRYVPGLPARDIETSDPKVIARAVGSGLYRQDRQRPAKADPAPEPVAEQPGTPAEGTDE